MTASDDAQVSRPRMSPEKRAKLQAEAWRLKDKGWGYRRIAKLFSERGDQVSHTLVMTLIKEAQEQAQYLDLIGPAEMRAVQLGYIDGAMERVEAAMEAGDCEFVPGMKLQIALLKLAKEIGGSAMPTRMQVETTTNEAPPSAGTISAFAAAIDEYDQKLADPDGLDEFDH